MNIFTFFSIFFTLFIGTATQECQCPNTASTCLGYDRKLQANTLDEAIANFPDLTLEEEAEEPSDDECVTKECQDCRKDMRKQLKKIGLLEKDVNEALASANATSSCTRYRFLREKEKNKKEKKDDDDHDDDDDDSSSSSSDSDEKENKKQGKEERKRRKKAEKQQSRRKRQATPTTNSTLIGTQFTLSCTKKGVIVDVTGTVSLCTSCWVWRRLPANYQPQYINELVCDNSDNECLSGYATCSVGTRTFEATRTDNGVSTRVTLSAGSYCECRVSSSSALQSLVTGSGISGNFAPQIGNNSQV